MENNVDGQKQLPLRQVQHKKHLRNNTRPFALDTSGCKAAESTNTNKNGQTSFWVDDGRIDLEGKDHHMVSRMCGVFNNKDGQPTKK